MILLNVGIFILVFSFGSDQILCQEETNSKFLTEKAYSKLFQTRRKESKQLLDILMSEDNYERQYKLVEAAYDKLLKILQETKSRLTASQYDPMVDKFPSQNVKLLEAVTVTLENTCLFGEIVLHLPDISYRALETRQNHNSDLPYWKDLINWCIKYTRYFNDRIIDNKGQQLLFLMEQEINPEKRTDDFINPYRKKMEKQSHEKEKKSKKIKKGPQMIGRNEL